MYIWIQLLICIINILFFSLQFGLRQLDLSLLSQLWALNDSIQEFRTMIQEHDQDDDETYSTHSHSPSPYDSVSSDNEDEILALKQKKSMELQNGNVITTQPKLTTNTTTNNTSLSSPSSTSLTTAAMTMNEQKLQMLKPPLPKPLDVKPVPRMRSAPPPPPTHRKSQMAPPRPTWCYLSDFFAEVKTVMCKVIVGDAKKSDETKFKINSEQLQQHYNPRVTNTSENNQQMFKRNLTTEDHP